MEKFTQLTHEEYCQLLSGVAKEAMGSWDIQQDGVEITLLKYRENAVFKIRLLNGDQFALRIHRMNYHSDIALQSELQWMTELSQSEISVPTIIKTKDGSLFAYVKTKDFPEAHQCDLLSWVEGEQIAQVETLHLLDTSTIKDVYRTVGNLAAKLHIQSSEWTKPKGFYRKHWDIEGCIGINAIWGCWDNLETLNDGQKRILNGAIAIAKRKLNHYGKTVGNYGLIHSDFAPENLLKKGSRIHIIDFDDCGFGWFMWEIVTALFFQLDEDYYDVSHQSILKGYGEIRTITSRDLEILPTLFFIRGLVYLGWMHTRKETENAINMTDKVVELTLSQASNLLESDY